MTRVPVSLPRGLLLCRSSQEAEEGEKVPSQTLSHLDHAWQRMWACTGTFGTQPGGPSSRWHMMARVLGAKPLSTHMGKLRLSYLGLGCQHKARSPDLGHYPST